MSSSHNHASALSQAAQRFRDKRNLTKALAVARNMNLARFVFYIELKRQIQARGYSEYQAVQLTNRFFILMDASKEELKNAGINLDT
jgi:hypothetical protein